MEQLSSIDAALLAVETATCPMHLGLVGIFDPSTAPPGQLERLVELRLGLLGLFQRRVVEVPGRLDRPVWVDAPYGQMGDHLDRACLAPPGGPHELGDLVGAMLSELLDRSHPLWRLRHVEGLRDGKEALILKIHHAVTDGANGTRLLDVAFDLEAGASLDRSDLVSPAPRPEPSSIDLLGRAGISLATSPARLARALSDVARAVPGLARFALSSERTDAAFPFTAPRGPFNGTLTSRRKFAYCSIPLADAREVKQAFGVTMNDVVLAICAGALRQYLRDRDQLPNRPLVAQVPIAVRRGGQRGKLDAMPGNFLSGMGAALPVHLDGPGDRLRAVHASTRAAKRLHTALGENLLSDLVGIAPPSVISALVGMYTKLHLDRVHPPIFSAIVSSVAGSQVPVYSCGTRLLAAYPFGPLLAGSGLNITVMSYAGSLDVGISVCPDIVDDPWAIAEALPSALAELLEASERPDPTRASVRPRRLEPA